MGRLHHHPEGKTPKLAAPVPHDQPQTNNRAELLAALEALKRCNKPMPITLYSDSQLVVKGANKWLPNWKAKGWKNSGKKSVAHRDLWEQIDHFIGQREVTFVWVEGHTGNRGNEEADALACRGANGECVHELTVAVEAA
nr:ribonuclease H [Pseudomonas sp. S5D5]